MQYKEAYDRELMQHGNTMQELVMVKQQLETEQESLAEADEAVKVAEEKLAANDVSITSSDVNTFQLNVCLQSCKSCIHNQTCTSYNIHAYIWTYI